MIRLRDVQAGLRLCCSHTPEDRLSRVKAQIMSHFISWEMQVAFASDSRRHCVYLWVTCYIFQLQLNFFL